MPKDKLSWDLTPLFAGDNDRAIKVARERAEALTATFVKKWEPRQDYLAAPAILAEALNDYTNWIKEDGAAAREQYYFGLRRSQDSVSPALKAKAKQASDFGKKIANQMQFFMLRLAKVSPETQAKFLAAPELSQYKHLLERLFAERRHLLSEPEEKIMLLKSSVAHSNWVRLTKNFLAKETASIKVKGKKQTLPLASLSSLTADSHKPTRDEAARAFQTIINRYVEIAEAELNSILEDKKINDELRHLARPDSFRHLADDVETEVVDTAIAAVRNGFAVSQRFYKLKAKLFRVKRLAYHERNVPYGDVKQTYDYQKSVALVEQSLTDLNPDWAKILKRFVANRQIDVRPRRGKSAGAFCAGEATLPTYILLNHTNRLRDVTTLAHEFGHGLNNELMRAAQSPLNYGSPLSTAEVASTYMEGFVFDRLLAQTDDKTKLILLVDKLDEEISTIHRQAAAYLFEQELHATFRREGYLTHQAIGKIFQKHMKAYMGPAINQDPGSENWWVYWSHFRNFFYVYSYATGLLIAKALQASTRRDPKFVTKVTEFLATGSSLAPREIFSKLGIDIGSPTFWTSGLAETKHLLDQAEVLAKKLKMI
jgi:oligoendopeptidase F